MQVSEYIAYLLSEPYKSSCVRSSQVLQISHDEVNRFLCSSDFSGKELFDKTSEAIELQGGVLSIDDVVIDKPFSDPECTELVGYFWSGRHHKQVKGINLIVLHYTDSQGISMPVNFRVYRHSDHKTKNDYFQQMCREVFGWGLHPAFVTMDSWYSSVENLKFLRNQEVGVLTGLENNRIVSTTPHLYEKLQDIAIPPEGLYTHLKGFDYVKVFRTVDTEDHVRHYGLYLSDAEQLKTTDRDLFKTLKKQHWQIEEMFRAIKQLVHAGHFFVRRTEAIKSHLFAVLRAFQKLMLMAKDDIIQSLYTLQSQLFLKVQKEFIQQFA
ncbi:MAG: transposase [Bacteroidota bacterium]|nr:transposase [Bacteroidota bacterium]